MSLSLDTSHQPGPPEISGSRRPASGPRGRGRAPLQVGLVNLMPPAARLATEWQFARLLDEAGAGRALALTSFTPFRSAADDTQWSFGSLLRAPLDELWDRKLDALIVTGTEPRAAALPDEPMWPLLSRLVDWAGDHTASTIWSCLAAHAAVLRLDGVARQKLPTKMSGVFACVRTGEHAVAGRLPNRWEVPHSRNNDLPADELARRGYVIISSLADGGADSFLKLSGDSLFLMLQGHPEYDGDCLMREYRRDMKRFLSGRRATHPGLPVDYFDAATEAALRALRDEAIAGPSAALLSRLGPLTARPRPQTWHDAAVRLFAGWLAYLESRTAISPAPARPGAVAVVAR